MSPPPKKKLRLQKSSASTVRPSDTWSNAATTQDTINDEGKIIEAFNALRDDVVKALGDTSAALELKREAEDKLAAANDEHKKDSAMYVTEMKSLKQQLLKAKEETRVVRQELASERQLAKWEFEKTIKASQGKNELKTTAKQLVDLPLFSGFTGSASGEPGEKFDKVREALRKMG